MQSSSTNISAKPCTKSTNDGAKQINAKSIKNTLGDRVNVLEKWKWLIIGGSIVIGFILARNFPLVVELMKVQ